MLYKIRYTSDELPLRIEFVHLNGRKLRRCRATTGKQ